MEDTAETPPTQNKPNTPDSKPSRVNTTTTPGRNTSSVKYDQIVKEQQIQDYGAGKRGAHIYLLCIMSVFSLLMVIAALSTNIYTKTTRDWSVEKTMWYSELCYGGTCTATGLPDGACIAERARQRSIQCFAILALLANLVAIAVSALDIVQRCPHELLPIVTFSILHLFTLMTWALIAGGYHATHCSLPGSSSLSNAGYKMSVSFSLVLSLWMMQFFMLIFYFVKRFLGAYQRRAINSWVGGAENDQSLYSGANISQSRGTPRRGGGRTVSSRYEGNSPSASRRDRELNTPGASRSHRSQFSHMTDAVMGRGEMNTTVHQDHDHML